MFHSILRLLNGFLLCLAMLMAVNYTSDLVYHNPPPARPAYNISGKDLPPEPEIRPEMIAQTPPTSLSDTTDGARIFRQCAVCHTASEQGPNRVGPSLWNIVNRPVGSVEDYRYSRALQDLAQTGAIWDEQRLDAYIAAPAQAVAGTSMAFRGLSDGSARAAIIAYLRTLAAQNGQAHD